MIGAAAERMRSCRCAEKVRMQGSFTLIDTERVRYTHDHPSRLTLRLRDPASWGD